jgi:hypothetical protein
MIISEWPAMIMVTAERLAPGDTWYGIRKNFKIELFDEPEHVTQTGPLSIDLFKIRIDSHGSDGVVGFSLMDIHHQVLIKKGK